MDELTVEDHPLLELAAFVTEWPAPLEQRSTPSWLQALAAVDADTPLPGFDDTVKGAVRDLLRHGGFKPAGRNKPCNEYIRGVAAKGRFPAINPAVDATNLAALHGGLPASTVDLDRLTAPLRVGLAAAGARYVFNASEQVIDVSGLLCLHDADGPCANAVKDAQRAKTLPSTTRTLTLVWGTRTLAGRAEQVAAWHRDVNERLGASVASLPLRVER